MSDALSRAKRDHQAGRLRQAEAGYRQCLQAQPQHPESLHFLAVTLLQQDRIDEALPVLRQAMAVPQPNPATLGLYAVVCRRQGRIAEGLQAVERAHRAGRRDATTLAIHGSLQVMAGEFAAAEPLLRDALAADPALAETWQYLGIALHRQGRWGEARIAYERALRLAPQDPVSHYNIALCAEALGDLERAREGFEFVCRVAPDRVDCLGRLAGVQALLCDWQGEAASVAALEHRLCAPLTTPAKDFVEPFLLTFLPLSPRAGKAVLDRYTERLESEVAGLPPLAPAVRAPAPRLRLGYVSGDFGHHAVGGLIRDVFAAHDRKSVDVLAYSLMQHQGDTADAIRAGCDVFRACDTLSISALAAQIRADRIDVLIDLGGYTLGARPALLALRPAPVQIGYLGFIHDYGGRWLDYLVLDRHVAPPGSETGFRHPLIRLPGTLLPAPAAPGNAVPDRSRFGLPAGVPLLASFNNSYKLDPELQQAWLQILGRLPAAQLVLTLPHAAEAHFSASWRAGGGDCAQLRFVPRISPGDQADRAASCDLLLDAFRYQAGATGVAAAGAGLPLLTREGTTPLSRLGVSLNRFLGMDDLVCADTAQYVERASALCTPGNLDEARARLRRAVAVRGLFNPRRTAAALEAAVRQAWSEKQSGRQGRLIDVA